MTMAYELLRKDVCEANKALARSGLVVMTWGNVSGLDREAGVMAIKPSGVEYDALIPDDIVVISVKDGSVVVGTLKPSSDTSTHLLLYRQFDEIGGIVHTHSRYATSWAQAGREIPCLGTTHADHFYGTVPVTRLLSQVEVRNHYGLNIGKVIVERFAETGLNPLEMPCVLVSRHGPFTWGTTPQKALENAIVLEETACMAYQTLYINPKANPISQDLLDKHFVRKHGRGATYGQKQ